MPHNEDCLIGHWNSCDIYQSVRNNAGQDSLSAHWMRQLRRIIATGVDNINTQIERFLNSNSLRMASVERILPNITFLRESGSI